MEKKVSNVISLRHARARFAHRRHPGRPFHGSATLLPFGEGGPLAMRARGIQQHDRRHGRRDAVLRHHRKMEEVQPKAGIAGGRRIAAGRERSNGGVSKTGASGDLVVTDPEGPEFTNSLLPGGDHGDRLRQTDIGVQRQTGTPNRSNAPMNTTGERIRALREERGVTRHELAKAAGIAYSTLADLENGNAKRTSVLHRIGEYLHARTAWLETGKGPREPEQAQGDTAWSDIRGVQQVAALGDGAVPDEYAETHKLKFRAESLRRKHLRPDRLAVLYGRGDSMSPTIEDGDAILFDTSDTNLKDDRVYVVNYEGQLLAKRIVQIGDVWCISSDNSTDPKWKKPVPIDAVRGFQVLGRVRWVAGWLD